MRLSFATSLLIFVSATALVPAGLELDCSSAFALPLAGSEQLLEAIKESKEFPEDRLFKVQISASEARISTNAQSKIDNDYKIEAVLLARVLMQKFPEINRVVIEFHKLEAEKDGKFKQVTVTRPELVSFGSGQVTSGTLLDAIAIEEKLTAPDPVKVAKEEKKALREESSLKAAEAYKQAVAKGEHPEAKWETYHAPGLAFDYPAVWTKASELDGEIIVKFKSSQTTYKTARLALRVFRSAEKTPVMEEARRRARIHQGYNKFKILHPSYVLVIGKDRNIKAVCESISHFKDGVMLYERHVYFGWPGYVYKLNCSASREDFRHVDGVFSHMLDTVRLESSATSAKQR